MKTEWIVGLVSIYIMCVAFSIAIFYPLYQDDKINGFECLSLSLFWIITIPYKILKDLITGIRKI